MFSDAFSNTLSSKLGFLCMKRVDTIIRKLTTAVTANKVSLNAINSASLIGGLVKNNILKLPVSSRNGSVEVIYLICMIANTLNKKIIIYTSVRNRLFWLILSTSILYLYVSSIKYYCFSLDIYA